jgi:uncharacterized protein (TIGR03084 family)
MEQAGHFLEESEALNGALAHVTDWNRPTQFKGWTINDVFVHLHFWNRAADMSVTDPDGFMAMIGDALKGVQTTGMRPVENAIVEVRGDDLRTAWIALARDMGARWAMLDPKMRVKWAGPDMSVRSSMTARQMETWAHGMEVFDLLGVERVESDRVKNIVILGVNTFGWGYMVRGMNAPGAMPRLRLIAPSGEIWEFGDGADMIEGPAVDFAAVVTQTRNIADTDLRINGPVAGDWMANAQCFAGPSETPPAKGQRFTQTG